MCTDLKRGGERPGTPARIETASVAWVSEHDSGSPYRPSPSRLWQPVPAFALTTLAARTGLRHHDLGSVLPISCLEQLWGTPGFGSRFWVLIVVCGVHDSAR
jgi:hypothetical protein